MVSEWYMIHKKKGRTVIDPARMIRLFEVPGGGIEPPIRGFSV